MGKFALNINNQLCKKGYTSVCTILCDQSLRLWRNYRKRRGKQKKVPAYYYYYR